MARVDRNGRAQRRDLGVVPYRGIQPGSHGRCAPILPCNRRTKGHQVRIAEKVGVDLTRHTKHRDIARARVGCKAVERLLHRRPPVLRVLLGHGVTVTVHIMRRMEPVEHLTAHIAHHCLDGCRPDIDPDQNRFSAFRHSFTALDGLHRP